MSVQSLISEVIAFGNEIGSVSPSADSYHKAVANYRKQARDLKLVKDRHAVNLVLESVLNTVSRSELTLGYMCEGVMYVTHKSAIKHSIPGCLSTEVLHNKNLTQSEWNSLPKYHVWVKTGRVLGRCL